MMCLYDYWWECLRNVWHIENLFASFDLTIKHFLILIFLNSITRNFQAPYEYRLSTRFSEPKLHLCEHFNVFINIPLQWRHNERDGVSNHQSDDCLLRRRSKKTSKLCVSGLCEGNSPVTSEFPAQRASNAENVSIWWRLHVLNFL